MSLFVLIIVLTINHAFTKKLPPHFTVCSRNDPNLNECYCQAVQKVLALSTEPTPELFIPAIDPITLDKIEIPLAQTNNFKFSQTLYDLKLHNLKEAKLNRCEVNLGTDEFAIVSYSRTPSLRLLGNYHVNGKVLLLVVNGNGSFTVNFDDVYTVMNMTGTIVQKKGKEYIALKDLKVKFTPKNVTFKFDNLFNGNKQLDDTMNQLLNENWSTIYEEIGSVYEDIAASFLKNAIHQVFNKIPYDNLFPI
ncbi:hypothetical protein RN001_010342 [Aquatica leii]|uniref:Takeout n=1 Tax=Aquatica leii TaxID=1421715 RepID=A0AAN7P9T8_9COLE|nr:hypothetical protein RN001_010342 [Aquatica leii]